MKSNTRKALDEILSRHPDGDLTALDVQEPNQFSMMSGPWVLVGITEALTPKGEENPVEVQVVSYAVWKQTGAIYNFDGFAVDDDPIWEPEKTDGE